MDAQMDNAQISLFKLVEMFLHVATCTGALSKYTYMFHIQ